jgi:hypothetical protein
MPYIPDWEPLSAALTRIIRVTGVEESEAKADLCNAIADKKISVRVTLARGKRVYAGGNVGPPVHLEPQDLDWDNSRPNASWMIGPMLGQYGWTDDWEKKQIDLVEVSTADVLDTLCTNYVTCEDAGASNPSFSGGRASAPEPSAPERHMSLIDMRTKLPPFLKELQAKSQQNQERFNQESALEAATYHFSRQIDRPRFREIYNSNGLQQKVGRPRRNKIPPNS